MMKKLTFTALLMASLSSAVFAAGTEKKIREGKTTSKEKKIIPLIEAALAAPYPETQDGHWKVTAITEHYQQAAYLQNGIRKSLFFTPDNARMLASIQFVSAEELGKKISEKVAKKYQGFDIAQVVKYYDGHTLYFVLLRKGSEEILVSFVK